MKRHILAQKFGAVVRQLRAAQQLSQEAFAERCGLHHTYLGCIERGEKNVTLETAANIAQTLDLDLTARFAQVERSE
jgi:transcriptional regulator with XRE-family HTH domain